ncbi:MAG: Gfo/Idh/MocA family oxidoreductase [Bacteroidales bacterium]|jgi:predicted dehydrogenase|nr:Gfo/Idh/MocA family oxidoreductase [Bacteroidales bacterium]
MINRRYFIKASSLFAAGIAASSFPQQAFAGIRGANDTIGVALIGCNSMGWSDLKDFLLNKNVRCLALCDVDNNVLQRRAAELEKDHNMKANLYDDYRKILDQKDVDIVIIGTPDHWHCLQMVDACAAGKDVYVEKPASNSIAECDAMVAAAKRYNRIVQVGQQQRSGKEWQDMVEYIQSGKLGTVSRVHVFANFDYAVIVPPAPDAAVPEGVDFDKWLGPAPKRTFNPQRFHGLWRMFWNYGGGLITDWGVHLLDMGLWAMNVKGMPLSVQSTGSNYAYPDGAHETFDTMSVNYQFKNFLMTWENNPAGTLFGKNYGLIFRGTNGTLAADRADWEVFPYNGKIPAIKVTSTGKSHKDHVANFLECVKTRNPNTACTIENGAMCAKYAHLGNIGARLGGETLVYNDQTKKFNNPDANKLMTPTYRAPWKFPAIV